MSDMKEIVVHRCLTRFELPPSFIELLLRQDPPLEERSVRRIRLEVCVLVSQGPEKCPAVRILILLSEDQREEKFP